MVHYTSQDKFKFFKFQNSSNPGSSVCNPGLESTNVPKRNPGDLAIIHSIHETYHHRHGEIIRRGAICLWDCSFQRRVQTPKSKSGTVILPLHCACRNPQGLHPLPLQMSLQNRKNTLSVCVSTACWISWWFIYSVTCHQWERRIHTAGTKP